MNHKPRILTFSERIYQHLLYLYPAGHRREYGPQMVQLFRDISRQTYRQDQAIGVLGLWLRLLPDLGVSAGIEHLSELKGNGMRRFCARANIDPAMTWFMLASVAMIALGTLAKAFIIGLGGSIWLATAVLVGANLAAATLMEIVGRTRGVVIIPALILVVSALLPLLWLKEPERWLRDNPINAFVIIIAAYWYTSGRGRPSWPVYAVGIIIAAAQIATSLLR